VLITLGDFHHQEGLSMEAGPKVIKILVLGDPGTGKTSIIKRFVYETYLKQHKTTIGIDFAIKTVKVKTGEETEEDVQLQLWDIAGQERFGAISRVYYKDAFGVLLVYDLLKPSTFDTVEKWKCEIDSKVALPNDKPIPVLLVGNKKDKDVGEVDPDFLNQFIQNHGFIGWEDCSAKTGDNVHDSVMRLANNIMTHPDIFAKQQKIRGIFTPGIDRNPDEGSGCCR